MRVIDLTYLMEEDMPVYPGTKPPTLERVLTLEEHNFRETLLTMYSHTGTHMDSPAHIVNGGAYLDEMDAGFFLGKGTVIDLSRLDVPCYDISHIAPHTGRMANVDFVLLQTGWSRHWGTPQYYEGYPYLSEEAAAYLAGFPLRGIGVDAISVDKMNSPDFPSHRILMEKGMVVIENIANMDKIRDTIFMFGAFPLKFKLGDGSPVRALAIEDMAGAFS